MAVTTSQYDTLLAPHIDVGRGLQMEKNTVQSATSVSLISCTQLSCGFSTVKFHSCPLQGEHMGKMEKSKMMECRRSLDNLYIAVLFMTGCIYTCIRIPTLACKPST